MIKRSQTQNTEAATSPALSAAQQLRQLEETERQMAAQKVQLREQAEAERVAEQRKEIRSRIEATRQIISATLSKKQKIERDLDEVLNRAQALAAEAARTVTDVGRVTEDAIVSIKASGASPDEVEAFRNSLATVTPSSRTAFCTFRSSRSRFTEAITVDMVDRGDWEQFRHASRLVLVIEKRA